MSQNTWGKWIHIQWHEELLSMQKKQQMVQQQMGAGGEQQQGGMGGGMQTPEEPMEPQVGVAKQNPREAASSLRTEAVSNAGKNQQF
jgi:hypothetical protein